MIRSHADVVGSLLLPAELIREIEDAASKIAVQGARYPEQIEQMTGR